MNQHYINPFEFVPLPDNGPRQLDPSFRQAPLYEGYIEYSIKPLTPLHITGKTTKSGRCFDTKFFYENYGQKVIPGSSVKGALSAFIEALTGSDLKVFTRGDETGSSEIPAYGKHFDRSGKKNRHVGFLMASENENHLADIKSKPLTYNHNGRQKNRLHFERHKTLPNGFGMHKDEDVARHLFGFVDEDVKKENNEEDEQIHTVPSARSGKLIFEDILVPGNVNMTDAKAWDLDGDAIMGGPNPRASTAWYFEPGGERIRRMDRGFQVWEVLAGKSRGRKFYFHQYPDQCHNEYRRWRQWSPLREYTVQAILPDQEIRGGRLYFTGLSDSMLVLLVYSVMLESGLAHKLGALKPFGFGSVQFLIDDLVYRDMAVPLKPLESQGLKSPVNTGLFDMRAYRHLKRILHFPQPDEKQTYVFVYPPFNQDRNVPARERGFAVVPDARRASKPENTEKKTMHFDKYQKSAKNFEDVMGGVDYGHLK